MAEILATGQLAVLTTAAQVVAADGDRYTLRLTNTGAATVFVGLVGVTITTGHAIPAGGTLLLRTTAAVYAVAAATGSTLTYLSEDS